MRFLGYIVASVFRAPYFGFFLFGFFLMAQFAFAFSDANWLQKMVGFWFCAFWIVAAYFVSRFDDLLLYNPYRKERNAYDVRGDSPQVLPGAISGLIGLSGWVFAYLPLMLVYPDGLPRF